MDDLKPCPFCGGKAEQPFPHHAHGGMVRCRCCGAEAFGPKWNTRTPDLAAEVLRLRAEVERLRKALEDIADGMGETSLSKIGRFAPAIARAALKTKGTE